MRGGKSHFLKSLPPVHLDELVIVIKFSAALVIHCISKKNSSCNLFITLLFTKTYDELSKHTALIFFISLRFEFFWSIKNNVLHIYILPLSMSDWCLRPKTCASVTKLKSLCSTILCLYFKVFHHAGLIFKNQQDILIVHLSSKVFDFIAMSCN